MSAVLVAVVNGSTVLDAGSGIVLCQDNSKTFVLTCAHTLVPVGSRVADREQNPIRITVNGIDAHTNDDEALKRLDLAVLTVQGKVGVPAILRIPPTNFRQTVRCEGFIGFHRRHFQHHQVEGKVASTINTLTDDGTVSLYFGIRATSRGVGFVKGLSGGPVYDSSNKVIAVARMMVASSDDAKVGGRSSTRPGSNHAYAIQLSTEVVGLVREKVGCKISCSNSAESQANSADSQDRPPLPGPPNSKSLKDDDIQRHRWGGKSEGYGCKLYIRIVNKHRRYFVFDAVLETTDKQPLEGPVVFHLHDSYSKSVIWIRKTAGGRAVLEEIDASGTYTLGVQFKRYDKSGKVFWASLEFDLAKRVDLRKYDE